VKRHKDCGRFKTREELEKFVIWCFENTRANHLEIAKAAKVNRMTAFRIIQSRPKRRLNLLAAYRKSL
jgi:hypothetical protein